MAGADGRQPRRLVQLDWLDNLGNRSADRIHPEWQEIYLGDRLAGTPGREPLVGGRGVGAGALPGAPHVARPARSSLRPRGAEAALLQSDSIWAFQLHELPGGGTRLVVSGYWALQPPWLLPIASIIFLEPSHWIMQTRQFANLKHRAERDSVDPSQPPSSSDAVAGVAR